MATDATRQADTAAGAQDKHRAPGYSVADQGVARESAELSTRVNAAGAPEMPETVAYRWIPSETWRDYVHSNDAALRDIALECGAPVENLVTAASARAYGQAMAEHARRVALEEAAKLCDARFADRSACGFPREANSARALAAAIRAAAQTQGGS